MGGAASHAQKAAVKYHQTNLQQNSKKYDSNQILGAGPGVFESSVPEDQKQAEAHREQGPINPRQSTYRSKETPSAMPSARDDSQRQVSAEDPLELSRGSNMRLSKVSRASVIGGGLLDLSEKAAAKETRSKSHAASGFAGEITAEGRRTSKRMTVSMVDEDAPGLLQEMRSASKRLSVTAEEGDVTARSGSKRMSLAGMRQSSKEAQQGLATSSSLPSLGQRASAAGSKGSSGSKEMVPQQPKLEIVETPGLMEVLSMSNNVHKAQGSNSVDRAGQRRTTLHQTHSDKRDQVLQAKSSKERAGDPLGGLAVGAKVIGEGKAGQEMGIGVVVGPSQTPGMVLVKMEASGREMSLPAAKLHTLQDERSVKAAEKIVKRVVDRAPHRRSTTG